MTHSNVKIGEDEDSTTVKLTGKEYEATAIIFFDENCYFCKMLAQFISKLTPKGLYSLQSAPAGFQDSLNVTVLKPEKSHFKGALAWEWLIENHPTLKQVHWLAERLHLVTPIAKTINRSTTFIRKYCKSCST